jgi:PAS domain S-box-containing protein
LISPAPFGAGGNRSKNAVKRKGEFIQAQGLFREPGNRLPEQGRFCAMNPWAARSGMNRTHIERFVLISLIFIIVQIAVLGLALAALKMINATRAYATGESLYSKAADAAVLNLYRYTNTGEEAYRHAFQSSLDVIVGDRRARKELSKPDPDLEIATAGFLRGRNNIADIPDAILVFRLFRRWGPFAAAIEDWRRGDETIDRLHAVAEKLHVLQQSGAGITGAVREQLIGEIDTLSTRLASFENSFAAHIASAARIAARLVIRTLCIASLLLWSLAIGLAWRTYRRGIVAEIRLKESEERFRDFAETASDWFWETGPDLKITYLAERFSEATGVLPQDLLGRSAREVGWYAMADNDDRQRVATAAGQGALLSCVCRYVPGNGDVQYWKIGGLAVFGANGEFLGYRGTGSNVTSEIRAQQALSEAKELADLANRTKSEFLANMSHELRTPLNSILGFSEIIKDRLFGNAFDKYFDYAHDIFDSGTLLLALVNDILDLAKIEAGRMELYEEIVDVSCIIEAVIHLLHEKLAAASLHMETKITAGLPPIRADQRKLKQILLNLLSNAIKFTPAGGSISIAAALDSEDGDLEIVIRDTGIGIARQEISKVLEPFGQIENSLTRSHAGTGLGLPLVKALTELHGGTVAITSRVGHGTEVVITLSRDRLVVGRPATGDDETASELALRSD